jgi:hypothetical protein
MPKSIENEWAKVIARKSKMEKIYNFNKHQIIFELGGFCIRPLAKVNLG